MGTTVGIRSTFVGFAVALLLILGAGLAGACTTPNWVIVDPAELGSGAQVTVTGGGYAAGPVDLRWGGLDGDPLGTAEADAAGRFTASVTLPEVAAGRYSLTAVQAAADGTRLWGFTDIVLPEPAGTPLTPTTVGAAGLLLLLAAGVLASLLVTRRRAVTSPPGLDDGELERFLDEHDGESRSRSPVP